MPTVTDSELAQAWLYAGANPIKATYIDRVPETVTDLAVTVEELSSLRKGETFENHYAWQEQRWLMRISAVTSDYAALFALAALIQTALDGTRGTTALGTVHRCILSGDFRQVETPPAGDIKSIGGFWTLCVKGT